MRTLTLLFLSFAGLYAQTSPEFTISIAPPTTPYTSLFYRDGSNNVEYICKALSNQPNYVWYAANGSPVLTSIVDSSNTATVTTAVDHGLLVGNRVQIFGVTTDVDLNATYVVASVPTTATFTITTANVTDGTYNGTSDSGMKMATNSPRTNASIWSIQRNFYTTTYIDRTSWAEGATSTTNSCASRTSYAYN
jgi:hypothetical protein